MSQRVKRPNRSEDGSVPVKRRKRTAAEEEETAALAVAQTSSQGSWQSTRPNDLKTIYNRTTTEAPAELFRKDLISAMKLPDSEPLASDEYWVIVDQWKQEWERGVQVPVNPESLPEPIVSVTRCKSLKMQKDFRLPKSKYVRITKDENFSSDSHAFSNAPAQAEAACAYDLDEVDVEWLRVTNAERANSGLSPIYEDQLERVIESFELCCWDKIQSILKNEEGLGIEYDETVICDVCRSPDSEDGNEMVFCDSCNICVHQACYGITKIPEGQWLCCTCNLGIKPDCVLCPNKGGAMKSTRSGQKWAHVSCALWIPEVSIGCVEKMEPITKISSIPSSRWALICVLCRERVGACIQCSVKTCKTAYHVTCAFKHGLEMRAIIEDENADDGVKLRSYCEKHSKSCKKSEKSVCSGSEADDEKRKKRKEMTNEEKNQARAARLQEVESEFYKHVTIKDITMQHNVDNDALQYIYNYWKLKRKSLNNKPLLPPRTDDVDVLSHKREQADLEKMKSFVQLRQDLERVRNLCYMVSRREKLSRSFFRMREQTFHKQVAVLESSNTLPTAVVNAVIEANHGPSIYDRLYSHSEAEDHTHDFETILARIAGVKSPTNSGDERTVNGLFKDVKENDAPNKLKGRQHASAIEKKMAVNVFEGLKRAFPNSSVEYCAEMCERLTHFSSKNNPYKKIYFNGSSKRRTSLYDSSLSSASSSEEKPKDNKENRLQTTSEDDTVQSKKKTPTSRKSAARQKRQSISSAKSRLDSSSEEDIRPNRSTHSRLSQVMKEIGDSDTDSDGLSTSFAKTFKKSDNNQKKDIPTIYSDSEDSSTDGSGKDDKSSNATNDSGKMVRTKASMKDFTAKPSVSKSPVKTCAENKKKVKNDEEKDKKDYASDLIVPQRQAAKKAAENLNKLTTRGKELFLSQDEAASKQVEEKAAKKSFENKSIKSKEETSPGKLEEKDSHHKKDDKKLLKPKLTRRAATKENAKEKEAEQEKEKEKENRKKLDTKSTLDPDAQELLAAFVPQRQAAKKAAEHIKSGLVKPVNNVPETSPPDSKKDPAESPKAKKKDETETKSKLESKREPDTAKLPAKVTESKRKSSTHSTHTTSSSSSTSSGSSSDSSSSSTSDSEDEHLEKSIQAPSQQHQKQQPPQSESQTTAPASSAPKQQSLEPAKRSSSSAEDWPFLDKAPKSGAQRTESPRALPPKQRAAPSSSSASSSDSSDSGDNSSPSPDASPSRRKVAAFSTPKPSTRCASGQPSTQSKEQQSAEVTRVNATSAGLGAGTSGTTDHRGRLRKPSGDKTLAPSPPKREEQSSRRGRPPKAQRGRARRVSQASGDRIGDANVRPRDSSDDQQRSHSETERSKKLRKSQGKQIITDEEPLRRSDAEHRKSETAQKPEEKPLRQFGEAKKTPDSVAKLLSSREKTQKTLKENSSVQKENNFEREINERKITKDENSKTEENKSQERLRTKINQEKERLPEKIIKKPDSIIKEPNKELKEQVDKKTTNKKSLSKGRSIDDIFADKMRNDTKENKITPSKTKINDEISVADKIVDDHVQSQKQKESELFQKSLDILDNKSILSEQDIETKNATRQIEVLHSRSIFSPRSHSKEDRDLLDFDFDDGFDMNKDDEVLKQPLTSFGPVLNNAIKEDSREDSARETLNLVEKLRMGLSKKSTSGETDECASNEIESDREQVVPNNGIPEESAVSGVSKENREPINKVAGQNTSEFSSQKPANYAQGIPFKSQERTFKSQDQSFRHQETSENRHKPQHYPYSEPNLCLDSMKTVPVTQPQPMAHGAPIQGDERWVPPSNTFSEPQPPLFTDNADFMAQQFQNSQHENQIVDSIQNIEQIPPIDQVPSILSQMTTAKEQQPLTPIPNTPRIPPPTPMHDTATMDCMQSPYPDIHPQRKWAEFEVMPKRRSSRSSSSDSSSSSSRKEDGGNRSQPDSRMVNHSSLDMTGVMTGPVSSQPYPPPVMDNFGTPFPDTQFGPPVTLFAPPNINTQMPFGPGSQVPGIPGSGGMFSSMPPQFGAPFPNSTHMPPIPKSLEDAMAFPLPCTAAFTSSQQNMELTAAMVNMADAAAPKVPEQDLQEHLSSSRDQSLTPTMAKQPFVDDIVPSPALSSATPTSTSALPSPSTSLKSNNSSISKKSPAKPTRTSARVTSQLMNKSPAKSPGKSPRQQELNQKPPGRGRGDHKRGGGRGAPGKTQTTARGKGRGRGRGRGSHHNDFDFIGANTIHNKLVGTVYDLDFDDDISNDNMTDLKSMRERRKSIDVHDKRYDSFNSPKSPKFSSPSQLLHKSSSRFNADHLRDLRPPSPIEGTKSKSIENDTPRVFPDVTPVLPGPVDMRTYNNSTSYDQHTYNEHNLLSAFASGTAENQLHEDIDEDFEKELHSALTAKKPEPPTPKEENSNSSSSNNIKVSLSDDRNQLKVKIKGPIANYTSSVASLPPPAVEANTANSNVITPSVNAMSSASIGMSAGGTSSLRRMRKKELLKQYISGSQDLNLDEAASGTGFSVIPALPTVNRTTITIPKAISSMTSIPTKEDYQDYRTNEEHFETKHHKKSRPLAREMRQLDLSVDDDLHRERRGSVGSSTSNSFDSNANKRRGRPVAKPTAPKLKIKFGNSIVNTEKPTEERSLRPPKKRIPSTPVVKPSLDDLKRQSMEFRKQIMADLKVKDKHKDRKEKHKKKKERKRDREMRIISDAPTKLIIRFGSKSSKSEVRTSETCEINSRTHPEVPDDSEPPKLTPIKLKLSRSGVGSGYVMKPSSEPGSSKTDEDQATQPGQPPPLIVPAPAGTPSPPPLSEADPLAIQQDPLALQPDPAPEPLNKDCEVR